MCSLGWPKVASSRPESQAPPPQTGATPRMALDALVAASACRVSFDLYPVAEIEDNCSGDLFEGEQQVTFLDAFRQMLI